MTFVVGKDRKEAERVIAIADLVSVGVIGAAARKAKHGDRVTFGRVAVVESGKLPAERGECGEVRITGAPASAEEAIAWTKAAKSFANGAVLTGFSTADLLNLVNGDHMALADLAKLLKASGLEGIAEVPIDKLGEDPSEVIRAIQNGGLTARRATITEARFDARLDLIELAEMVQRETGAFDAFAPLPRIDPIDVPSTGYDDVKTIVVTRILAPSIAQVQVDWVLYGPKLAQVAIEYGADDIDGVAALDIEKLGTRRSPKADIERQIRSAFAEPAERNGRYEIVPGLPSRPRD